jgi:polyvinyl alcohol dehydrogenase (cytochrome)
MNMRVLGAVLAATMVQLVPARADVPSAQAAAQQMGAKLFQDRCAGCHDAAGSKAPPRAQLAQRSIEDIGKALVLGPMAPQAQGLSMQQIGLLATYLSHKAVRPDPIATANMCKSVPPLDLAGAQWNGWGRDGANTRFQPAPGLKAGDVGKLKLKWAFSYTGSMVYGQPTLVGGRVFVTSLSGRVQALDARTGCTIWSYELGSGSRTAISVGSVGSGAAAKAIAFVGDESATVHALDASSGAQLWAAKVDAHPAARVTGAPGLYAGRLYVPVASTEEAGAAPPYHCCTFRGGVVALDAATGKQIWKAYTIQETPHAYGKAKDGTQLFGPAGASVWSAPTIDEKLGRLYVGTSNSYSGVPTKASDAITAFSLKDGAQIWSNQVTHDDNFVIGCFVQKPPVCNFGICNGPGEGPCPAKVGQDLDFGASPILRTLPNGKRVLLAGQKSATVYGMDPDHGGAILWQTKVGIGGPAGGIEWGMAADQRTVYAPSSDIYMTTPDKAGGLTALDIATGKQLWHAAPAPVCAWGRENCWASQSQAVSAIPGVVFSGGLDGHLRAFGAKDGAVAWDFDTAQTFATVNQGPQGGGSLNLGGATIAGGMLFVNSGYGRFAGQNGHVLLAFAVK